MHTSSGLTYRRSIRLKDFDYADAIFFITACSARRRIVFGDVEIDHVNLSAIGKVVERNWLATSDLRPDVVLDEFIVMPNHFHAVLSVGRSKGERADTANLGSVVRGFKGSVTSDVRAMLDNDRFEVWQRGYYEHVIRSAQDLRRRREYTRTNPLRWAFDRDNPAMEQSRVDHAVQPFSAGKSIYEER